MPGLAAAIHPARPRLHRRLVAQHRCGAGAAGWARVVMDVAYGGRVGGEGDGDDGRRRRRQWATSLPRRLEWLTKRTSQT
jgi:hypothetical protein